MFSQRNFLDKEQERKEKRHDISGFFKVNTEEIKRKLPKNGKNTFLEQLKRSKRQDDVSGNGERWENMRLCLGASYRAETLEVG